MIHHVHSSFYRLAVTFTLACISTLLAARSQVDTLSTAVNFQADSIIALSAADGAGYISRILKEEELWRPDEQDVKRSLQRMLDQYAEPYDSAEQRLLRYPFDSVSFELQDMVSYDSLSVTWLNDSSLIIDNVELDREPYKEVPRIVTREVDTTFLYGEGLTEFDLMLDTLLKLEGHETRMIDTVLTFADTIMIPVIDTMFLDSMQVPLYRLTGSRLEPPLPMAPGQQMDWSPDSSHLIVSTSRALLVGEEKSPFYIVPGTYVTDSLRAAVNAIAEFTYRRDSILIYFSDLTGNQQPFWLTSEEDDLKRYWIKNRKNDSITIWVGNPSKSEISLLLEDDVNINRMEKILANDIPITTHEPNTSLVKVEPLKAIPVYWEYGFSSSFALNQTYLSNWSKGGESSLSTMLDIKGEAAYHDKATKTEWKNDGRIKYGSIITAENGLRTNTDMLEVNSQFNRTISKQVDFSAIFYTKHQLARGYNYPNDSVVVSRFLNPGTFTIGVGVEYKPFKNTEINFSPLSYKNTFVLDTAEIDQTNHGIEPDKRARQEMGGQLRVKNKLEILEGLNISNSLRLFSNYFDQPQNVDVDWEITLEKRISWYASVALNLHMIYDDNIRFPVLGDDGVPLKLPDGSIRKAPKLQFKEFIGLTFALKF
jgi:hypothetical protein